MNIQIPKGLAFEKVSYNVSLLSASEVSPKKTDSTGSTYYVDNTSGNDLNSGLTQDDAWKTLLKVNSFCFKPTSTILFKRNNEWRGHLLPKSGDESGKITYGAYGLGDRPVLNGSIDLGNFGAWEMLDDKIWRTKQLCYEVGNVIFNDAKCFGVKVWNYQDITKDKDFYYDKKEKYLYICSEENPGNRYMKVEAAIGRHVIDHSNTSYVVFENLHITKGGAHGFGGGNTHHLIIQDCEISFIGGAECPGLPSVRYGNGVEFWSNAHDNMVTRNIIHEIYDTGVTNQSHSSTSAQYNLYYYNNLFIGCCFSSFEFWIKDGESYADNIHFENNTCLNSGLGWGAQRPDSKGFNVFLGKSTEKISNIFIRNNIFFEGLSHVLADVKSKGCWPAIEMDYNCYWNNRGRENQLWYFSTGMEFSHSYTWNQFEEYKKDDFNKDSHSIADNPAFVNYNFLDLSLEPESPCLELGKNIGIVLNAESKHSLNRIGAYIYIIESSKTQLA